MDGFNTINSNSESKNNWNDSKYSTFESFKIKRK
jgi:hypothetical protein